MTIPETKIKQTEEERKAKRIEYINNKRKEDPEYRAKQAVATAKWRAIPENHLKQLEYMRKYNAKKLGYEYKPRC
jgi:hypothetical protein